MSMIIDGTSGETFPDGTLQASAGGMVNLGTITFSGTGQQFSLTGLTLTSYKQLYIVINGMTQGTTGTSNISISGFSGDQSSTYWNTNGGGTGTQFWIYGAFIIDLLSGITIGGNSITRPTASASMPATANNVPNSTKEYITGIGNASTGVYVYFQATTTKSGTITVYGVR